jgi:hypothetical protein
MPIHNNFDGHIVWVDLTSTPSRNKYIKSKPSEFIPTREKHNSDALELESPHGWTAYAGTVAILSM